MRASLFAVLTLLFVSAASVGGEENKWSEVCRGSVGADVFANMILIADRDECILWPAKKNLFSPLKKSLSELPLSYPSDYSPHSWHFGFNPTQNIYLPNRKKILFAQIQHHHRSKGRDIIASWYMDPATGKWEVAMRNFWMSERPESVCKVKPGRGTNPVPLWGRLVYDAHNHEALLFGGSAVWGRTSKAKIDVKEGDWVVEEGALPRRITAADKITSARRWFPGRAGTWLFSEKTETWTPLAQPLQQQPPARIFPGMAYVPNQKKILLFGGDNQTRCLDDTWIYDCVKKEWSRIQTQGAPLARAAHGMVYVEDQDVVLITGGYGGGWKGLKDTWTFDLKSRRWHRLELDLPSLGSYCSAVYHARNKTTYAVSFARPRGNSKLPSTFYSLKLNTMIAKKIAPASAPEKKSAYHSLTAKNVYAPLPGEWPRSKEDLKPGWIEKLPANEWVLQKPPVNVPLRGWGIYIYDTRSHQGFAWGGGHCCYPGAAIHTYRLLEKRWVGMKDPDLFCPVFHHGLAGGPGGATFSGWTPLDTHARKSYAVDPVTNTVVTIFGDVFSIETRQFIKRIPMYLPRNTNMSTQESYVTTPHGIYAHNATPGGKTFFCRLDVKKGKWDVVAITTKSGIGHNEHNHMTYDSKRDRILYFTSGLGKAPGKVWAFTLKTKELLREEPNGKSPHKLLGDSTYIPDMDAALLVHSGKLWFYKCAEKKWYFAPYRGNKRLGSNASGRDHSPIYDPKLKVVIRFTGHPTEHRKVGVSLMRLEPKTLELTEVN